MQIFLQAMAVCSGMDIAAILHKRRRIIQSFRIEVEGTRREEHPRIFTHIKLIYIVSGVGINEEEIQRAMDFSVNKYCSIMGMVDKRKMKIEVEYRIE
jgi:putative redox protein